MALLDEMLLVSFNKAPEVAGGGVSTWINRAKTGEVATTRIGGRRFIVVNWGGKAPPRDGRPPSLAELIRENLVTPETPLKAMPKGVHRGRPRKHPIRTDRGDSAPMAVAPQVIRMVDPNVPVTTVWASRGKVTRAEPVSALYEQGRMHHVGSFPQLEDQMTNFTSDFDREKAGYSPDRLDALVFATTELLVEKMKGYAFYEVMRRQAAGETLEQIAMGPTPGAVTENQPAAPTESLLDVYRRTAAEFRKT
jgi:hypothetical protein